MTQSLNLVAKDSDSLRVYFGTYTGTKSKGIYSARLNLKTGELSAPELAGETPSPSFLAMHPSKKFLYAVNEVGNYQGQKAGSITGFSIDADSGKLTRINEVSSGGADPCHLVISKNGKYALAANYSGGSVVVAAIDASGKLGEQTAFVQHKGSSVDRSRQREPHAHSINLSPDNKFAFAADLGLDKVLSYHFDAKTGTLKENPEGTGRVTPGSGPRHFAFHPNGKVAFVINELNMTLTSLSYDAAKGQLQAIESASTFPNPPNGTSTAEVQVHPNGRFVYGSNRGANTIAIFKFTAGKGHLELVDNVATQGRTPRNFTIDPSGKYLVAANQDSDSVVVFSIDQKTGLLTPTGSKIEIGKPVCVKFLPN